MTNKDWIRYDKNFPASESKSVLITYTTFWGDSVAIAEWEKYIGWYIVTNHGPVHIKDEDVKAWMPLPSVYKENTF